MPNHSPWLHQLNRTRPVERLKQNVQTDVAIVGCGIAGITTAYFTLKNTRKSVFLIEADKVAHGASGHNAGQMVSYFERQISSLVEEFGLEQTAEAQRAVYSAWDLLDEMYKDTGLTTPFAQFTGYAGFQDIDEVIVHLENNAVSKIANINSEPMMIADNWEGLSQIPEKYKGLYSLVPHENILNLLETEDKNFIAVIMARKGVMNSALFCEDMLQYLLTTYAHRITLVEESPVREVALWRDKAVLVILDYTVTANRVVLCTNGFERFTITNFAGDDINTQFHHLVNGRVGYMAAYLEEHSRSPVAISYLPKTNPNQPENFDPDPYFYLTRRTFELEQNQVHSLICIGGPESKMDDSNNYHKEHPYPDEAQAQIDKFLHSSYKHAPKGEINYEYKWHGLMGYTPNGVRCVGPEPINPVLLYNLGCNGIGILPSIYSGKKIAQFLNGEELAPSIFDPQDSREKQKKRK